MAQQKLLDDYRAPTRLPVKEEAKAEAPPSPTITNVETVEQKKKQRTFPPIAPPNLPASYFVSASYDGRSRKAIIKLYEPQSGEIYFWYDNTGHKPYCLTNLSQIELEKIDRLVKHEGFDCFEVEEKFDPLENLNIKVTKIVARDPLAVGGQVTVKLHDGRLIKRPLPNLKNEKKK